MRYGVAFASNGPTSAFSCDACTCACVCPARTRSGVMGVIFGTDALSAGSSGRCGSNRMPGANAHAANNGTTLNDTTAFRIFGMLTNMNAS